MLDSNGSFDNPFFQDKKIVKIDCKWKGQEYSKDTFGFTHAEYVCSFILKENPEAEIVLLPIVRKNKKSTVLDMIEGIELLIEEQVDIINMSMGDEYKYHKEIEEVCRAATEKGILIGAICAAPSILGHKGLLEGKRAVCFPGFESELKGAEVRAEAVVTDGAVITSKGAGTANEFAFALAEKLLSKERADKLAASVQWKK